MRPASSPSLEFPQVFQLQRVESHGLAQEQQRRLVTVVDRAEMAVGGAKIDEAHVRLVPILERKLALDALIMRERDGSHLVFHSVPLELVAADRGAIRRQRAWRAADEGDVVLKLCV